MIPEDIKVMAFDVIKKAIADWGYEDEKGFLLYCDDVCELAERVADELERVGELCRK